MTDIEVIKGDNITTQVHKTRISTRGSPLAEEDGLVEDGEELV
jgi:hypothetical protein